jgi:hypothetical protein
VGFILIDRTRPGVLISLPRLTWRSAPFRAAFPPCPTDAAGRFLIQEITIIYQRLGSPAKRRADERLAYYFETDGSFSSGVI